MIRARTRFARRTGRLPESFWLSRRSVSAIDFPSRVANPVWPDGKTTAGTRRGSILLIAMVCLMLIMTIFGAILQMAQASRAQIRRDVLRSQARWLAEAGASRAGAALVADPNYSGETWIVPASDLNGEDSASVKITVRREGSPAIEVLAEYPADQPDRVRYAHEWPLPDSGSPGNPEAGPS